MILRKMDDIGRVIIPAQYREKLGLKPGELMAIEEFRMDAKTCVLVSKHRNACLGCGKECKIGGLCDECRAVLRAGGRGR